MKLVLPTFLVVVAVARVGPPFLEVFVNVVLPTLRLVVTVLVVFPLLFVDVVNRVLPTFLTVLVVLLDRVAMLASFFVIVSSDLDHLLSIYYHPYICISIETIEMLAFRKHCSGGRGTFP